TLNRDAPRGLLKLQTSPLFQGSRDVSDIPSTAETSAAVNKSHAFLRGACAVVVVAAVASKRMERSIRRMSPSLQARHSRAKAGGESGIRTHGRVSPTHAFQACSLNHSDISPLKTLTVPYIRSAVPPGLGKHRSFVIDPQQS